MKTNLQIDEYFLENLLTKNSLSNCITTIPQKINLVLDKATNNIILKAGSKIIYFDNMVKEITTDIKQPALSFDYGNKWLLTISKDCQLSLYHINTCFTGKGVPTLTQYTNMLYLDLDTLHFHSTTDTGTTWVDNGVCAILGEIIATGNKYESISYTFNGFGYFANLLFSTPETEVLIPNGIDTKKGNCANIKTEHKKIILHVLTEPEKKNIVNGTLVLFENNIEIYPEVNYDKKKNLNSTTNTVIKAAVVGKASTNELGRITEFSINDILNIPQDINTVHKLGNETINGIKTFTSNIKMSKNNFDNGITLNADDNNLCLLTEPSISANGNEIATAKWVNSKVGSAVGKPGEIVPSFATVKEGALLCNGAAISKTDYPRLFEVIQYKYGGSGDSFNLPDLRGQYLTGAGSEVALKNIVGAGLPNITGTVYSIEAHNVLLGWANYTKCFSASDSGAVEYANGGGDWGGNRPRKLELNAAKCSSIYGSSSTVRPKSVGVNFFIIY